MVAFGTIGFLNKINSIASTYDGESILHTLCVKLTWFHFGDWSV